MPKTVMISIGILTLIIHLPGCTSLKEKRGLLKPIIARLHREFNISISEVDRQDSWQEAVLACALVSNHHQFSQQSLQKVVNFTISQYPNIQIIEHSIELL